MKARTKGRLAEFLARCLFRIQGYGIVSANCRGQKGTGIGEVDFIAKRQNVIVFVEVKQRSSVENAAYSFKSEQQKRIWRAAEIFLQKHPAFQTCEVRFDTVLISLPFKVRHIKDAFRF